MRGPGSTPRRRDRGWLGRGGVPVAVGLSSALLALAPALGLADTPSPPPPTPVPVAGGSTSPSPFPSVLHTPPPSSLRPPSLEAASAVLVDRGSGETLFSQDAGEKRPVASLTKIMTAYLVLSRTSPTDVVTVSENAASGSVVGISGLGLLPGERIEVRQLVYALLLQSANDAAVALAEHVGGTVEGFVEIMNRSAERLGMSRTRFTSPNGLDDAGYSTARDLARLTLAAYRLPGFSEVVASRTHVVPAPEGPPRVIQNRNALLWLYPGALGVKTGFTSAAGFCMAAAADREDESLVAVVLGAPDEAFSDAAALLNFGFAAFERRRLVEPAERLGSVEIDGRQVAVAAGGGLDALLPVQAVIDRDLVLDPRVRYPPGLGQPVGSLVVSRSGGPVLGEVPLLVTGVPPPEPLGDDEPWWSRALGAVLDAGAGLLEALLSSAQSGPSAVGRAP